MTFTVSFQNEGLIDPIAITTFGINVKEGDNPIGYFGTGLKYAIAVLLRHECEIEIHAGRERYKFGLQHSVVRGKEFSIITMNNNPTGFTTELGKNWKLWMAFRELYCNTLDESGSIHEGDLEPQEDHTTIVVRGTPLQEVYHNKASIVLESEPLTSTPEIDIHPGESKYVYYRGVRIHNLDKPSLYTYNIRQTTELTEDRTPKWPHYLRLLMARGLMRLEEDHKGIVQHTITASRNHEESNLDFTDAMNPSEAALGVAETNRLTEGLNSTIHTLLISHNRRLPLEPMELNSIRAQQLERAIRFCKSLGYPVENYPIIVTDQLKGGLLGLAEDNKIYLAPKTFDMGTKYVASTILEEYLHLDTGFGDMTRDLQNHLFDIIMSFGERIIGEPL